MIKCVHHHDHIWGNPGNGTSFSTLQHDFSTFMMPLIIRCINEFIAWTLCILKSLEHSMIHITCR